MAMFVTKSKLNVSTDRRSTHSDGTGDIKSACYGLEMNLASFAIQNFVCSSFPTSSKITCL